MLLKHALSLKERYRKMRGDKSPSDVALAAGAGTMGGYVAQDTIRRKLLDLMERKAVPKMSMDEIRSMIRAGDVVVSKIPPAGSTALTLETVLPRLKGTRFSDE